MCVNVNCPFKVEYSVVNTTQVEKRRGSIECKGCSKSPELVLCTARRYESYGKRSLTVYHCGQHTCPMIKPSPKIRAKLDSS